MGKKSGLFALRKQQSERGGGDAIKADLSGNSKDAKEAGVVPFVLPQQGLQVMVQATKTIYATAMNHYNLNHPDAEDDEEDVGKFISQDDLFPIILFCVIQSKLEHPHRLIDFVEHVLPTQKTTMGQGAFALSCLKSAVQYITHADPTTFGLDAEIELD